MDSVILGVSRDSLKSHDRFIEKIGIPFVLLWDTDGKVMSEYDVIQEKSAFGKTALGVVRSTFLIGPDGRVLKVYRKPKAAQHAEEVLKDLTGILSGR